MTLKLVLFTALRSNGSTRIEKIVVEVEDGMTTVDEVKQQLWQQVFTLHGATGTSHDYNEDSCQSEYDGILCKSDYELDYYMPTKQADDPSLTATVKMVFPAAVPPYTTVFLTMPTGKTRPFAMHRDATIEEFMKGIRMVEGIPVEEQRLIFAGKQLEYAKRLSDYNIQNKRSVQLMLRGRGGSMGFLTKSFADVSNRASMQQRQWDESAPEWRMVKAGLCIEGICKNRTCKAYTRMVIHNWGCRLFDLHVDGVECKCPVPGCGASIEPVTCAFNNCRWRASGMKVVNGEAVSFRAGWSTAGDCYERFSDAGGNQVEWRRLLLTAK